MAFVIRRLCVLGYAQGNTLWSYKGAGDSLPAIAAPDYFNDAGDMLSPGDTIVSTGDAGGVLLAVLSISYQPSGVTWVKTVKFS